MARDTKVRAAMSAAKRSVGSDPHTGTAPIERRLSLARELRQDQDEDNDQKQPAKTDTRHTIRAAAVPEGAEQDKHQQDDQDNRE